MTDVRRLEPRDRQAWQELFAQYNRFYRASVPDQVRDMNFDRLCDGDALVGIVAVDEADRPIGLMHLVFHPSTWSGNGYCYIEDLFVDRARRGSNVARSLFAEAYRIADARKADQVYWQTQEFNAPARSLYDTVGQRTSFIVYRR
ncbi:MAG TPA: GNAT family N-acetyltransferase [Geminicoccus sp.]|jgi:ribosomal protein S18 acetylase RimI-like enzyme|uniref:GNAT family N-acetyltransferase n=1 Tax=Geminicoccus sp. TaxID=2024832 RepID=UPI002E355472|nr:GNAT family N-acetyltransferase [Geminicoccus sp.]HEX2528447.1 GNAT family N-acetyltransferase [Geminicoccus sp.]